MSDQQLQAELAAAKQEAADARSTLTAWFDLAKKAEHAGADVLRDSLETWMRRALNGGMPSKHAEIARNILDEAARMYLWQALVPVLRGMHDQAKAEGMQTGAAQMQEKILQAVQQVYSDTCAPEHENRFAGYTHSEAGAEVAAEEILGVIKSIKL